MSKDINKVILVGTITESPEMRSTNSGVTVAQFHLQTCRRWRTADGRNHEKIEMHRCVAWNSASNQRLADLVNRLSSRGTRVYVEGRVEYRSYVDRENVTKYVTEVVISEFVVLNDQEVAA